VRLADFLDERRVFTDLEGNDKEQLLEKMVTELRRVGAVSEAEECLRVLLEREKLMSTGVKKGFAIPHAFTEQLDKPLLSVGIVPKGINYESLDGEPVYVVFLILGPKAGQGIHLKMLAHLSRLMNDKEFLDRMMAADGAVAVLDVIRSEEDKLGFEPA
jgi:PTS system nitrogen regulatory IIA component